MTFGQYLRELRSTKNLSTGKLAKKSDVSQAFVSQIERGLRVPSPQILRQLSKTLNVSYIGMLIKAGHVTEEEVLAYREQNGVYKH